ncbi:MAG: hypothetical protein ACXAD7_07510 [Candidatus Kariarchaeaceae archaeon]|jgi:DNA-binding NtrC family response regulator
MKKEVILLGTHFLFKEELGSRLRGLGHLVHSFDSVEDLGQRMKSEQFQVKLIIFDLQYHPIGGLPTLEKISNSSTPVLAIGEHKQADILKKAREFGVTKVIRNSQASKDIEGYVTAILEND